MAKKKKEEAAVTIFIDRDESGKIVGEFSRSQKPDHEKIDIADPEYVSFKSFDGKSINQALKAVRDQKIFGGISISGIPIDTDQITQARFTALQAKAAADDSFSVRWKLDEGERIDINAATIILIADAMVAHVQNCFNAEEAVDLSEVSDLEDLISRFNSEYDKL